MARTDRAEGMTVGEPDAKPVLEKAEIEPVNILLVDDRPSNLQSLKALLKRPDYNLLLARSGTEALAQVLRQDLALILLDIAMPGMDGFEVAEMIQAREQSRHIPIIFITASVFDMLHVFRRFRVGMVDYIRKPLDADLVRAKVDVFVQLYRQRKLIARLSARLREAEARVERCHVSHAMPPTDREG